MIFQFFRPTYQPDTCGADPRHWHFSQVGAGPEALGQKFVHLQNAQIYNFYSDNYIYNAKLGFLNGISLSVMAAKLVLQYPDAPLAFLLRRFFLTFSNW